MTSYKIQRAIYSLLKEEPFYAHFILNSKIVYDAYGVPTAGASVMGGVPMLIFNSAFMDSLSETGVKNVLKHEILHLLLEHMTTTKDQKLDPYLHNIATDCAINQYLDMAHFPPGTVTLDALSKALGLQLEAFQTSDYYYAKIKQRAKKASASGLKTLDEHGTQIPGADIAQIAEGTIKRAAQQALAQSAGNAPDFVIKQLGSLSDGKLPWRQLLRNSIMKQISRETKSTHKRINRRFALPVPGKKQKRTLTLGVCVDSSGSVSDANFKDFLDEVQSISKLVTKTYLIHADCEVQSVEDLSKGKIEPTRKGNGGTAYQPAITKCKELACDMIIYFGDFDTADRPKNPGVPFIWVGVGEQPPPGDFGKVIRL